MTKMKHAWFPVTLSFVLTHLSDRFNEKHSCRLIYIYKKDSCWLQQPIFIKSFIKSVWRVHKQKTQSYRESCVLHFGHFELYKFEYISLWNFYQQNYQIVECLYCSYSYFVLMFCQQSTGFLHLALARIQKFMTT